MKLGNLLIVLLPFSTSIASRGPPNGLVDQSLFNGTTYSIDTVLNAEDTDPDATADDMVMESNRFKRHAELETDWTPKCSQDSNLVFDPRFYLATYNDLRRAFIKPGIDSFAAATRHWCDYGVKEGRHGIASFSSKAYLARYKDLQWAFGKDNVVQATTHYINAGFNEGRSGYADIAPSTKGWKPKCFEDSKLVFDPRFYLAKYKDLRIAFIKPGINTFDVAAQHWCNHGVKEGRQGIASFSSKAYLARYGDLRNAFGNNNYIRATTHFIKHGFKEKRIGNIVSFPNDVCEGTNGIQDCPYGWTRYGSSCFRVFSNGGDIDQAEVACENQNGNVASIPDASTNVFVSELIPTICSNSLEYTDRIWIGLRRYTDGSWRWLDESPLNYKGWAQGSPSEVDRGGNCAEMVKAGGTVTWNQVPCRFIRAYVCEKKLLA